MRGGDQYVERDQTKPRAEDLSDFGGGSSCTARNEVWQIYVLGSPTGGSFDIDVSVEGAAAETLTINYDDTAAEIDTEFDTHTGITDGDVTVTGGPSPDASISVEFTGNLAAKHIAQTLPLVDWSNLTGAGEYGVLVIVREGRA